MDKRLCILTTPSITGNRIIRDLTEWMPASPEKVHRLHLRHCQSHRRRALVPVASCSNCRRIWQRCRLAVLAVLSVRKSEILSQLGRCTLADAEVHTEEGFEPRTPLPNASRLFTSEKNRQLLEREFLHAGTQIQGFAESPSAALKPLGFSPFVPGFGSLFVTYRNCPNNCPLALWYGDPDLGPDHPLSRWYPLFPRKTYN